MSVGSRVGDAGRALTGQRLYLLRHAESSWTDSWTCRSQSPAVISGRTCGEGDRPAPLRDHGIEPELVLCSSATRARETLERIGLARDAHVEPDLYGAGAAALPARLHEVPATVSSVMLIGHNPGLQELALLLSRPGPGVRELEAKFPTAALATLVLPGWSSLDRGTAELIDFVRPRDLER